MSELVDVLQRWMHTQHEGMHTAIPAKIVSYSGHAQRLARVQPLVRMQLDTGDLVEIPEIDNVPVVFPCTARSAIFFDLEPGDNVLLIFAEVGIGAYIDGDSTTIVDADDHSRFSLTDAIAIPGLHSASAKLPAAADRGLVITHKQVTFHLQDDRVSVTASNFELDGDLEVTGEITAKSATAPVKLSTHLHPTPVGPTSQPTPGT